MSEIKIGDVARVDGYTFVTGKKARVSPRQLFVVKDIILSDIGSGCRLVDNNGNLWDLDCCELYQTEVQHFIGHPPFSKPLSALELIPVEYPIVGDVCEGCYFNGEADSLYTPFACQFPGDPTAQCSVPAQGGTFENYVFVEKQGEEASRLEKLARIERQKKETIDQEEKGVTIRMATMTCCCGTERAVLMMHLCLYCAEWFCQSCAEVHFGQTVEQYKKDRIDESKGQS